MKVILYQVKYPATKGNQVRYETEILLDDGADGKNIATVKDHAMAQQIAKAMGWEVSEDNVAN